MARITAGGILATLIAAAAYSTAAQPVSSPSAAAPPSRRQLALARQLVESTGVTKSLSTTLHDMVGSAYASLPSTGSDEAQARRKVYEQAQADAMTRMAPKIVDSMVDGYARNFTEKELSDLLAFYQGPAGRVAIVKMPLVMRSVTSELIADLPQLRRDMGEEICAKVTCTTAERTAFFGASPKD